MDDNPAETIFLIWSAFAMIWVVIGIGLFYSGLTRKSSALIQAAFALICLCVVSVQYFCFGYSLTMSDGATSFIGGVKNFFFMNMLSKTPVEAAYVVYQGIFPSVTTSLMIGAIAERGTTIGAVVFIFLWSTIVYDPIDYWTWHSSGWANKMGALDYAGGLPVHIASGFGALAYSLVLGPRQRYGTADFGAIPHSSMLVVLGTFFLWVGWFGFNAGSSLHLTSRTLIALLNTQLSASAGGIAWALIDHKVNGTWSVVGFCSGIVAGLVSITPGAGFVQCWSALIIGAIGAVSANMATQLKFILDVDDALDVFAVHGCGGLMGTLLTGIFADKSIPALDPQHPPIEGGLINGNFKQIWLQIVTSAAGAMYAFFGSIVILVVLQAAGVELRVPLEAEADGLDLAEHDEYAYAYFDLNSSFHIQDDGLENGATQPDLSPTNHLNHLQHLDNFGAENSTDADDISSGDGTDSVKSLNNYRTMNAADGKSGTNLRAHVSAQTPLLSGVDDFSSH